MILLIKEVVAKDNCPTISLSSIQNAPSAALREMADCALHDVLAFLHRHLCPYCCTKTICTQPHPHPQNTVLDLLEVNSEH